MVPQTRLRIARWIAIPLVAVTYVLLVFGSTVRIHDAGLACPDWPMCFGQVIPVIDFGVALEFGHRVLAGLISLAFLGLAVVVFSARALRREVGALVGISAVVLVVQIILGGLTVLELLDIWTVTSHLVTGNTFCALLLVLALRLTEQGRDVQRPMLSWPERLLPVGVLALVFLQLGLGGLVASSHAGLACGPVFPNCAGSGWFPTFEGPVGLQVVHRIGAFVVLAGALVSALVLFRRSRIGVATLAVLGVVIAQATLGIVNVWTSMPAEITAAHSAGAALLVLTSTWASYEALRAPVFLARSAPLAHSVEAR